MKKKSLFLLVLSLLMLTACGSPREKPKSDEPLATRQSSIFHTAPVEHCRIIADTADVKEGMGMDFNTIATLNRDDVVRVLDQVGNWYVIQLDNNQVGSIETEKAEPIVKDGESPHLPLDRVDEGDNDPDDTNPAEGEQKYFVPDVFPQPEGLEPEGPPAPREAIEDDTPQRMEVGQQNERNIAPAPVGDLGNQAQEMVSLINQEREKNGLPTLEIDNEVAKVAGVKSQDMVDNDYFSHYSPTYGSPFEMLDSFGIKYLHAGENLAGNNTVDNAHVALMNSSGHRQNILNADFTHVGIGVRSSERYGYIYTQMFISKPR